MDSKNRSGWKQKFQKDEKNRFWWLSDFFERSN